jgi:hypothetical protein
MTMLVKWLSFTILLSALFGAEAQTISVASCSLSAVQNVLNSISPGGTVNVPSGNCSWSGLSVNKAVTLQGAGTGKTNITLSGNNTFTKAAAGVIRIQGFSFSVSGGGNANQPFTIGGSWKSAQPIIFQNDAFTTNGSGLFRIGVPGGVIFSHNTFSGQWDDSFLQLKDPPDSQGSWASADSIGTHDTSGLLNIYIEDNTFVGGTNATVDADDASRVVFRHNTDTNSSFNSHGYDTSPFGVRHFEVYSNKFLNTGAESNDCSQLANENWAVWIRGATGVIYDNYFDNLAGSCWGDKPEIKLSIRGAEDVRPQGSCSQVSYPVPRQLGQNHNGSSYFTDPIYLWGNTGTAQVSGGWNWGNPCGFNWNTFFQWGRDGINSAGTGGTAKPGYTAYTYPHPLTQSSGTSGTGPMPPIGLQAVVN